MLNRLITIKGGLIGLSNDNQKFMREIVKIDDVKKVVDPVFKELINKLSSKDALHLLEFFGLTYAFAYAADNFDFDYSEKVVQNLDENGNCVSQSRNYSKHIRFGKNNLN